MSDINEQPPVRKIGTSVTLIICSTVVFLSVLGAFIYLESIGRSTSGFMALLAFAAASLPGILGLRKTQQVVDQAEETKTVVEKIERQTNGQLNEQFNRQNAKIEEIKNAVDTFREVMRDIPIPEQRKATADDPEPEAGLR